VGLGVTRTAVPELDLTWMQDISLWQLALVGIFLILIGRLLFRFWPWLRRLVALVDALTKLPEFITKTTKAIDEIHHEVHYNNGSSVKDAVARVEEGVAGLYAEVKNLDRADAEIREELEQTRPGPATPRKTTRKKEQ
jgi:hypothetical protein